MFRNDATTVAALQTMAFSAMVISPGPGRPEDAGISLEIVRHFSGKIPILGVCLGHQTLAANFGAAIVPAKQIMHGKTSPVTADGRGLFAGISRPFTAMRYHSLAVSRENLPPCLEITATTEDGEIMGLRHREHPHPGSSVSP